MSNGSIFRHTNKQYSTKTFADEFGVSFDRLCYNSTFVGVPGKGVVFRECTFEIYDKITPLTETVFEHCTFVLNRSGCVLEVDKSILLYECTFEHNYEEKPNIMFRYYGEFRNQKLFELFLGSALRANAVVDMCKVEIPTLEQAERVFRVMDKNNIKYNVAVNVEVKKDEDYTLIYQNVLLKYYPFTTIPKRARVDMVLQVDEDHVLIRSRIEN